MGESHGEPCSALTAPLTSHPHPHPDRHLRPAMAPGTSSLASAPKPHMASGCPRAAPAHPAEQSTHLPDHLGMGLSSGTCQGKKLQYCKQHLLSFLAFCLHLSFSFSPDGRTTFGRNQLVPLRQSAAHSNGHHRHPWGSARHSEELPRATPRAWHCHGTGVTAAETSLGSSGHVLSQSK